MISREFICSSWAITSGVTGYLYVCVLSTLYTIYCALLGSVGAGSTITSTQRQYDAAGSLVRLVFRIVSSNGSRFIFCVNCIQSVDINKI